MVAEALSSPEVIDPQSIAIATTTFYPTWGPGETESLSPDKVRGDLALDTIREALRKGFQVCVVDGGSSKGFRNAVSELGVGIVSEEEKGMSGSRRQTIETASYLEKAKVICWTEPEKVSIVRDCLPEAAMPILRGEADIVVPSRSDESFATYPKYQVKFEKRANRLWNNILRSRGLLPEDSPDIDAWVGPRFIRNHPLIIDLFLKRYSAVKGERKLDEITDPELWPDATFLPLVAALKQGYRVKSVQVPYRHPEVQTTTEEDSESFRRKRDVQRKNIIVSTIHYIRMLEGDPRKPSKLIPQER